MKLALRIAIAVAVGVVFWFTAWPTFWPMVAAALPYEGKSEIQEVTVTEDPFTRRWSAVIRYEHDGWRGATVQTRASASGHQPTSFARETRPAMKGQHRIVVPLPRPFIRDALTTDEVVVEMVRTGPEPKVVAAHRIKAPITWPDSETWHLDGKVLASPAAALQSAQALVAKGDLRSLVEARRLLQRLLARDPKSQPAIEELTKIATLAPWGEATEFMATRKTMRDMIFLLRNMDGYEELDLVAHRLREKDGVTANGGSALALFHTVMWTKWFEHDKKAATYARIDQNADRWLRLRPKSTLAHLNRANESLERAWEIRGGGFANSLTNGQVEGLKVFGEKALQTLIACASTCAEDPHWYTMTLKAMVAAGAPRDQYFAVFSEGYSRFPRYGPLQAEAAFRLTPQWGGSAELFEDFARQVALGAEPPLRDSTYAHVYASSWFLGDPARIPPKMDCGRVVKGFEADAAAHPTSINLNQAAVAATGCRNKAAAQRLFARIAGQAELSVWGGGAEEAASRFANAAAWAK